ncbi:hypothetical protein A2697_02025 [Candidatus Curtissbacteria bacterium RIFCSPHIGHO2_01_FULL_41_44]|uniref:Uncharacterized protein n=1 Tax=Candidatus Curtissbacteria bacterium RIFCSPLOWO2_01_FULL_42_50 TaxID=1797730 RepID=A0A1F5H3Q6_9BACT|nr:MAG: hypothetical protein A2697_02025 [Candidatus Curtissbacteria bacterium RIFCSPHIGHO2_01_FULL_41_44]OGD98802.1 MAG: hypothetical protein A3B54_03900 [Candidatus Curtissbacteria bacterium RIFCSPLOWO2_01_FULL_42_50]OGE11333.1 MAG: hypothetical protein A3H87_03830 [Candidatus Curtissbacteria bacterium RIFCSPLOWO2_02_FULL_42_37]
MKDNGFILPFVVLCLVIGMIIFYLIPKDSITPNDKTQKTARLIPRYLNTESWSVTDDKTFCVLNIADCTSPSSKIKFSTADSWSSIYRFYRNNMKDYDWQTKSTVITSVPTTIIFTNGSNCQAVLKESTGLFDKQQENLKDYLFSITCR